MEIYRSGDVAFVIYIRLTGVNEAYLIGPDEGAKLPGGDGFVRYHLSFIADFREIRKRRSRR
jgi:hypothetical protein